MTTVSRRLLAELARLYQQYEPAAWDSLAAAVADEKSRQQLVELLRGLAETSRMVKRKGRKMPRGDAAPALRGVLAELEKRDPEKYRLIAESRNALLAGSVLPSVRELRDFAANCGVEVPRGARRDQAVAAVVRFLVALPTEEVRLSLARASRVRRDLGRDFQRWAEIIMGNAVGDDSFVGPDGQLYRLTVGSLFSGIQGFLGIAKTAQAAVDVFIHVDVTGASLRRTYSLVLVSLDLEDISRRGLFPARPVQRDWQRLCVRLAPVHLFTEDCKLKDSDPRKLTEIVVPREDLEKACAAA